MLKKPKKKQRRKKALIISGGGARGAFAVGAIQALAERNQLDFDLVSGTSTGALIAPLVITRDIETLVHIYSNTRTDQVVRKKFLLWALLFGDSLYDTKPLEGLIAEFLPDHKANSILSSGKQLFIAATEFQSGKIMYFSNGNSPHPDLDTSFMKLSGPQMLRRAMLASSNQPIFMPPIEIHGKQFMDGGLRDVSPVKVALFEKIKDITIIDMIPEQNHAENMKFKRIPDLVGRGLDIMSKEIVEGDIARAKHAGAKLTIIRPKENLNKNPLDFDPKAMRQMLKIGYETARDILG